jgi:hypothetical protein
MELNTNKHCKQPPLTELELKCNVAQNELLSKLTLDQKKKFYQICQSIDESFKNSVRGKLAEIQREDAQARRVKKRLSPTSALRIAKKYCNIKPERKRVSTGKMEARDSFAKELDTLSFNIFTMIIEIKVHKWLNNSDFNPQAPASRTPASKDAFPSVSLTRCWKSQPRIASNLFSSNLPKSKRLPASVC